MRLRWPRISDSRLSWSTGLDFGFHKLINCSTLINPSSFFSNSEMRKSSIFGKSTDNAVNTPIEKSATATKVITTTIWISKEKLLSARPLTRH
jgi:hypothetical protein